MVYKEGEKVIFNDQVYMVWEINRFTKKYTLIRKGRESIEVTEEQLNNSILKR